VPYFDQYVERYKLPVNCGVRVTAVEPNPAAGYWVRAEGETYSAKNVVIATGLFQRPKLPACAAELPATILQLHSGQYRNPGALPPGALLVVGSAQSACQIAEELYQSGRRVYLSVGSAGRAPRRYRGRDIYGWLSLRGFIDRTPDKLPSPKAKFAGNPHLSGRDGGHNLNLHQFARDAVMLLGHLQGVNGGALRLASDLKENLASADKFEADVQKLIDGFIAQSGLEAPEEVVPQLRDGYAAEELRSLDLKSAGIGAVIWAMGYGFDFGLVPLPVFDADGFPVQTGDVSAYPGLYFVGLPWLPWQKSGLLIGIGENAAFIADHIAARDS
jgi:putative flavoprotein involved in K+ transport